MRTITASECPVAENPHGVDVRHIYSTADVMVSQITLAPGEAIKPHSPPVGVFFYVLEGAVQVEIDGESSLVACDTLVPSGVEHVHGMRNVSDAAARLLVVKTPNPLP